MQFESDPLRLHCQHTFLALWHRAKLSVLYLAFSRSSRSGETSHLDFFGTVQGSRIFAAPEPLSIMHLVVVGTRFKAHPVGLPCPAHSPPLVRRPVSRSV